MGTDDQMKKAAEAVQRLGKPAGAIPVQSELDAAPQPTVQPRRPAVPPRLHPPKTDAKHLGLDD